jgi:TolA-binding protein
MKKICFIALAVIAFVACQSPKEKALANIKALESNDSVFSPEQIQKTQEAYIDFATKYPNDEQAPEFLFKAGQRCNVSADHNKAIELFQQVIDQYPKHKIAEDALFLQAYIYENNLHNYPMAKAAYTKFIEMYPNSELKEDAVYSIQNLGKTPEQIFEALDKTDSVASAQ